MAAGSALPLPETRSGARRKAVEALERWCPVTYGRPTGLVLWASVCRAAAGLRFERSWRDYLAGRVPWIISRASGTAMTLAISGALIAGSAMDKPQRSPEWQGTGS